METKDPRGTKSLRKGRYSQTNRIYSITFVTDERTRWFEDFDLACTMCRSIVSAVHVTDAQPLCWVVMPDHVHLLLDLRTDSLGSVIQRLKAGSARVLNRQIGRKGRFWQPGYHDRALRHEENIKDTARYISGNPLRAGLTQKYGHYPFWNAIWL